jgi:predicted phosphodiesterase
VKVAALYDVHGNLPALEAVLDDVPDESMIVVGGDIVSGPQPAETLAALRRLGHRACFIRGNADREVVEGSEEHAAPWVRARLDADGLEFLDSLDHTVVLDVDRLGATLFCHASPRRDDESITAVTSPDRLRALVAGVEQRTIVCGHTHHQFDLHVDGTRVVNAGSIGIPYEGRPGAFWTSFGADVEFRSSEYDVDATLAAARDAGYPNAESLQQWLRDEIPTAAEVAEFFEQQALAAELS